MHEFSALTSLPVGTTRLVTIGIDFADSTQNVHFDLIASGRPIKINIRPPIGEMVRAITCSEGHFINEQSKLRGMNEHSCQLSMPLEAIDTKYLCTRISKAANVSFLSSSNPEILRYRFHFSNLK